MEIFLVTLFKEGISGLHQLRWGFAVKIPRQRPLHEPACAVADPAPGNIEGHGFPPERFQHVIAGADQIRRRIDQGAVEVKQDSPRGRPEGRRGITRIRLTHDGDSANAARIVLITVS